MPLHQDSQPSLQVHGTSFDFIECITNISINKVAQAWVGGMSANGQSKGLEHEKPRVQPHKDRMETHLGP